MYSKIILDALMEQASDREISRMVVLINEFSAYRDFADFHKHDPKWWEELADKIYTGSSHPKMALAPYIIAAGQRLIDSGDEPIEETVVPLVSKAMAIDEEHDAVQTLAKVTVAVKMGGLVAPTMRELRQHVLPKLLSAVKDLDNKLSYKE